MRIGVSGLPLTTIVSRDLFIADWSQYAKRIGRGRRPVTNAIYPAARAVAERVERHFARHLAAAREHAQQDLAPHPDAEAIEAVIDAAFWASLRREEGYIPTISLAFLPPEQADRPLRFELPLPFAPDALTKLAPAVKRPGIHLGVWRERQELVVWGTTRTLPAFCFVLEVIAPGLLVIKHRRNEEAAKFVNVAVLEGDQVKVLNQDAFPDCPPLVSSLLGSESAAPYADSADVLTQLALSMRAHGRGGLLLVVPRNTQAWRESIVRPIQYSVSPPFSALADLMREKPGESQQRRWQDALRRAVDGIAGLTAVDGATVVTDEYDLLAFGAKIGRRDGWAPVEQVLVTEPIEGARRSIVHPAQLGGTRHLSAAQFVQDQPDSVALVASQDGRFSIFAWSTCEQMLHAHRVETLLL
jgi:hypothetical protein